MELTVLFLAFSFLFLALRWRRRRFTSSAVTKNTLPSGPPGWPFVGNLFQVILQRRHFIFIVRDLKEKYGPIFTMKMGQQTLVIVTSPELIHEALVQKGSTFASRPPHSPIRLIFSLGKLGVNSADYGPLWRALRRNFVSELTGPIRIQQHRWIRDWALQDHMTRIEFEFETFGSIDVLSICRFTICQILIGICFCAKVTDDLIRKIDNVTKKVMLISTPHIPDYLPILTPLFRKQIRRAKEVRRIQLECLLSLVRNRRAFVERHEGPNSVIMSPIGAAYVDSLFGLDASGRGPLSDEELVTLCTEVFIAGIDTSASLLQWAFYELVVNQPIQEKIYAEIVERVGINGKIMDEDVDTMSYLNAVVKETLRVHSPAHLVLSHAATEETELGGYRIPANVNVEFYIEGMTKDPALWEDPNVFRPERFLNGDGVGVDMTGTRRPVKMLPFGAGRRVCPGLCLGVLHVKLMVARMVQAFKWVHMVECPPDPTEKFAFTVVMKYPLKAAILRRV